MSGDKTDFREVIAVNRAEQVVMLEDGAILPVTKWIDASGDLCEGKDAVAAVAGSETVGWWAIDLSLYSHATVH